ncbi:MAG: hypothetical protein MHMPM18_000845 [Marteilia pararefringens]
MPQDSSSGTSRHFSSLPLDFGEQKKDTSAAVAAAAADYLQSDVSWALQSRLTSLPCAELVGQLVSCNIPSVSACLEAAQLLHCVEAPDDQLDFIQEQLQNKFHNFDPIYGKFVEPHIKTYCSHILDLLRMKSSNTHFIATIESFLSVYPDELISPTFLNTRPNNVTLKVNIKSSLSDSNSYRLPFSYYPLFLKYNLALAYLNSVSKLDSCNASNRSKVISGLGKASYLFNKCSQFVSNNQATLKTAGSASKCFFFDENYLAFLSNFALLGIFHSEIMLFVSELKHQTAKNLDNPADINKLQKLLYGYATRLDSMLSNFRSECVTFQEFIGYIKCTAYNIFAAACVVNSYDDFSGYKDTGRAQSELIHAIFLLQKINSRNLKQIKEFEKSLGVLNTHAYIQHVPLWANCLRSVGFDVKMIPIGGDHENMLHSQGEKYKELQTSFKYLSDAFRNQFIAKLGEKSICLLINDFKDYYVPHLACRLKLKTVRDRHESLNQTRQLFYDIPSMDPNLQKKPLQFVYCVVESKLTADISKMQVLDTILANDLKSIGSDVINNLATKPNEEKEISALKTAYRTLKSQKSATLKDSDKWISQLKVLEGSDNVSKWSIQKFGYDFRKTSMTALTDQLKLRVDKADEVFEPIFVSILDFILNGSNSNDDDSSLNSHPPIAKNHIDELDSQVKRAMHDLPDDANAVMADIDRVCQYCEQLNHYMIQCLTWFSNINVLLLNVKHSLKFAQILKPYIKKAPRSAKIKYENVMKQLEFGNQVYMKAVNAFNNRGDREFNQNSKESAQYPTQIDSISSNVSSMSVTNNQPPMIGQNSGYAAVNQVYNQPPHYNADSGAFKPPQRASNYMSDGDYRASPSAAQGFLYDTADASSQSVFQSQPNGQPMYPHSFVSRVDENQANKSNYNPLIPQKAADLPGQATPGTNNPVYQYNNQPAHYQPQYDSVNQTGVPPQIPQGYNPNPAPYYPSHPTNSNSFNFQQPQVQQYQNPDYMGSNRPVHGPNPYGYQNQPSQPFYPYSGPPLYPQHYYQGNQFPNQPDPQQTQPAQPHPQANYNQYPQNFYQHNNGHNTSKKS